MLSVAEKKAKQDEYVTRELGPFAPSTLLGLGRMIRAAYLSIISDRKLIKNAGQDFLKETPYDRESYVGYLHLDAMSKTLTILESFLALIHALTFNSSHLAESLVHYPNMPSALIPKLNDRIFGSERHETVMKILSLPDVDNVGDLTAAERGLLTKLTDLSIEKFVDDYTVARDFYGSNLIPYNKMRHGMSVQLSMKSGSDRVNFAIDRIQMKYKPPNYVEINGKLPIGNTLVVVPVDERALGLYEKLAKEWDLYVRYIVDNLMAKMFNIGEGYLPCIMQVPGIWNLTYIPKTPMSSDEQHIFNGICEKIRPNFRPPDLKSHMQFNFGPKSESKVKAMIEKYYAATLWYTGEGDETSYEQRWQ